MRDWQTRRHPAVPHQTLLDAQGPFDQLPWILETLDDFGSIRIVHDQLVGRAFDNPANLDIDLCGRAVEGPDHQIAYRRDFSRSGAWICTVLQKNRAPDLAGAPAQRRDTKRPNEAPMNHRDHSMLGCRLAACGVALLTSAQAILVAQAPSAPAPSRPAQNAPAPARQGSSVDPARAERLYVSTDPGDHAIGYDFDRDVARKAEIDARYATVTKGIVDFRKISYRSRIGDLDIPAYLFEPLEKRGPRGHAAMVWVHGGVHGNWDITMWPFVKEAVSRGYVVICPDYRGSTGYGRDFHNEIDYGGYEIDDVLSAVDYLATLPYVDMDRLGIMGWSHGGYITLFTVFRDQTPFKAAAAIVPVTNLVFRLSYKGPAYQRDFATQKRIQGLPFEKPDLYIQRSPLYSVDKLKVPLLVHVATNDTDVNFVEDQQIIDALRSRKPNLAETKIYVDPPPGAAGGGHTFSRRVDARTLKREDSPEQIDSWTRTWAFFEWNLRPSLDKSTTSAARRPE